MTSDFPSNVDLVIYINLDKRTDRRDEIENEFKKLGIPESKILRWSAFEVSPGSLGCSISHLAVLRHIATLPESIQTIIIFEDDFQFIEDLELVKKSLIKFLSYPRDIWDMILLSYGIRRSEYVDELISRTYESYTTAGYMINRSALPRILENYRQGVEGLMKTGWSGYFIDNYWNHLAVTGRCFYFNRHLGSQRNSWSDVDNSMTCRASIDHTNLRSGK